MEDLDVTTVQWDAQRLLWVKRKPPRPSELIKTMFKEYEEQVKADELGLKKLSEGTSISTEQEAIEFFVRDFPNFKKLLERSDSMIWLREYLPKIRGIVR